MPKQLSQKNQIHFVFHERRKGLENVVRNEAGGGILRDWGGILKERETAGLADK